MRRREFLTLLGGAAACSPLAARAQQPGKLPTIGFLVAGTPSSHGPWVTGFVQRLRELGWIDRSMGLTMSQWAEFTRLPSGGTEIRTWGDLSSPNTMIGIATAKDLLASFVETWYENYRRTCDERASQSLELAG